MKKLIVLICLFFVLSSCNDTNTENENKTGFIEAKDGFIESVVNFFDKENEVVLEEINEEEKNEQAINTKETDKINEKINEEEIDKINKEINEVNRERTERINKEKTDKINEEINKVNEERTERINKEESDKINKKINDKISRINKAKLDNINMLKRLKKISDEAILKKALTWKIYQPENFKKITIRYPSSHFEAYTFNDSSCPSKQEINELISYSNNNESILKGDFGEIFLYNKTYFCKNTNSDPLVFGLIKGKKGEYSLISFKIIDKKNIKLTGYYIREFTEILRTAKYFPSDFNFISGKNNILDTRLLLKQNDLVEIKFKDSDYLINNNYSLVLKEKKNFIYNRLDASDYYVFFQNKATINNDNSISLFVNPKILKNNYDLYIAKNTSNYPSIISPIPLKIKNLNNTVVSNFLKNKNRIYETNYGNIFLLKPIVRGPKDYTELAQFYKGKIRFFGKTSSALTPYNDMGMQLRFIAEEKIIYSDINTDTDLDKFFSKAYIHNLKTKKLEKEIYKIGENIKIISGNKFYEIKGLYNENNDFFDIEINEKRLNVLKEPYPIDKNCDMFCSRWYTAINKDASQIFIIIEGKNTVIVDIDKLPGIKNNIVE